MTLAAHPDGIYGWQVESRPLLPMLVVTMAGRFKSGPLLPTLMVTLADRFKSGPLLPTLMVSGWQVQVIPLTANADGYYGWQVRVMTLVDNP